LLTWRIPELQHHIPHLHRPTIRTVKTGARVSISENMPGNPWRIFKRWPLRAGIGLLIKTQPLLALCFQSSSAVYCSGKDVGGAKSSAKGWP